MLYFLAGGGAFLLFALCAVFGFRAFLALVFGVPAVAIVGWYLVMFAQYPAEHARVQAIVCANPGNYSYVTCETPPPKVVVQRAPCAPDRSDTGAEILFGCDAEK
jgi:hypothetical protein